MKYFKKLAAAICAVAITLSVAGCADVSTVGSVDNQTINAGIYLLYEQTAIGEAQQEVDDQLKAMGTSSSKIENFSYYNYKGQDVLTVCSGPYIRAGKAVCRYPEQVQGAEPFTHRRGRGERKDLCKEDVEYRNLILWLQHRKNLRSEL